MRKSSPPTSLPSSAGEPATDDVTSSELLDDLGLREVRSLRGFEAVCEQIRQQIFRGDLRPGDRLPGERELAEQLNVSRSVVREAIRSLESTGLVESRMGAHGGLYIRASTPHGLTQAMNDMVSLARMPISVVTETRIELTATAIRLACERATEEELNAIEQDVQLHEDLFRKGRGSRNARSLSKFYHLLAQATHNDLLVMLVDAVSEVMRMILVARGPASSPGHGQRPAKSDEIPAVHAMQSGPVMRCVCICRTWRAYLEQQSVNKPSSGSPSPCCHPTMIRLLFWLSVLGITVASLVPVGMLPPQTLDVWDKAQHAIAFAWLGLCGSAGPTRSTCFASCLGC